MDSIKISRGELTELLVGNIDISRDFGYAPLYVEGMYLMMQAEQADDFILCSGKPVQLREIIEYVFTKLNIDKSKYKVSRELYRPADIENIYGDPGKAREKLGWNYALTYQDLLDKLLAEQLSNTS